MSLNGKRKQGLILEQQNSLIKNDPQSDSFALKMAKTKSLGTLYMCVVILCILPTTYSQSEDSCSFPGIKNNGNTKPFKASYAIGEIVTFYCYSNYVIVGQANLTCQGGNTWDAELPECVKVCPELSFPDTQVISRNVTLEDVNVIGDILVWECKDGYSIDSGQTNDQTVTICKPEGWFTESVITCSKISCPDPGIPIGVERDGNSFEFADVVTYTCSSMEDVISSGSSSRTCQSNGTWSGSSPVCTAIDCMDPGQHNLTTRTGDTFSYGAVLLYECVSNAAQVSGSVSIECQLDGTWSGEPLMCQYTTTHIITTMMMETTEPHLTSTEDNTVVVTEPPIVTEMQTSSNFTNSLSSGTAGSNTASTRTTSSRNTEKSDQGTITLSKSIIYVIALVSGSFVFVFLIGSGICIFTSDSRKRRRRSNAVQKTDWVLKHGKEEGEEGEEEEEPVYEAPPEYTPSNKYLKPYTPLTKPVVKNDSVRSEASYLTPEDITMHDYQNVPEVLTRL